MKKGIGGLLLGLVIGFNGYAQKPAVVTSNEPGWQKIGETTASFKMQNESISVLGADEFSAIKLKVKGAPLTIERLQVFYESGDMEEIRIERDVTPDAESEVIPLKHPDRDIRKVAFTYKTSSNVKGDKAEVELHGLKTNQPTGKDTYRTDKAEGDVERAAENTGRDVENAGKEVKEETKEAGREIREEAREVGDETEEKAEEIEQEAETSSDELREEAREAEDKLDKKAEKTGEDIENAAKKTGDGISEGVNEIGADLKDEKVEGKVAAGGETVYIEESGKYYYIDNKGKKVYVERSQLKDKDDDK